MANKITVKDLVKDPAWQKVRISLLGQWKERPDWCCSQLSHYLGNISTTSNEKLRIVMNYLTGSFFRTRKNPPCAIRIRTQISVEMKKRKAKGK